MRRYRTTVRRFIGGRRAISTLLANVIVITMVISLGTMLYVWTTGVMGTYQGAAGIWFSTRSEVMKERLAIEEVWFTNIAPGDQKNITIYMRNVGANEIKIAAVYVNSTQAWTGTKAINIGQVSRISLDLRLLTANNKWGKGCVTYISVATLRGTVVKGYWQAPA